MADDKKDLFDDAGYEIIELYNEATDKDEKWYWIDTVDHNGKQYAVFQPAEELEDVSEGEVLIHELVNTSEGSGIIPVEDEKLLEEVYQLYLKDVMAYYDSLNDEEFGCDGACAGCPSAKTCNLNQEDSDRK